MSAVQTLCVLGAESTGKTTLARALAAHLNTQYVPEFARDYWVSKHGQFEYADYLFIAQSQVKQEQQLLPQCSQWLVSDTSPLTTLIYALYHCKTADPALWDLSYKQYTHTFLCAPDIPFEQDGTRSSDTFRQWQHGQYVDMLRARNLSYTLLTGELTHRVQQVVNKITKTAV